MSRSRSNLRFRILALAVEGPAALAEVLWVAAGGLPRLPRPRGHSVPLDVLMDRMRRGCPQGRRESRVRVCDLRRISFPLTVTLRPQARLGLGGVAALPKVVLARYRSMDWVLVESSQCAASVRSREMGTS
jgi:hypothetical protein